MGVDFELSYGVKSDGELVSFILHAPRKDVIMNLATGVRRDHQGKGLTSLIYKRILEDIPRKGFRKMQLEVITENVRAINAYEKAGFTKVRKLLCWKGAPSEFLPGSGDYKIKYPELTHEHAQFTSFPYAFEMDVTAISRQAETLELHELREKGKLLAYAVWNPWKMNLIQLGGADRESITGLLSKMKLSGENFGMVNVDEKNDLLNGIFRDHNLTNYISQYEMERFL